MAKLSEKTKLLLKGEKKNLSKIKVKDVGYELASVVLQTYYVGLTDMINHSMGVPSSLSYQEWVEILHTMRKGVVARSLIMNSSFLIPQQDMPELNWRVREFSRLNEEWFEHLWD